MKIILIILTVIQLIGLISSASISGSIVSGIRDMQGGIILLAVLWAIWCGVKFFKQKKSDSKVDVDKQGLSD